MDCEKKYKEALERARQFSEKPYLEDSKGIVDYIFPELKESEDEKIRNQIIEHIKWSYDEQECAEEEMHRWISWLEKQGRLMKALQISNARIGELIEENYYLKEKQGEYAKFRDSIQVGDKVTRNQDGVLVNLSQLKRVAKPAEKQGEQKPAEEYNITGIGSKNAQGKLGEMIKNLKSVNEMKVEPKFNAGDFVRSKYNKAVVLRIEEVCNDVYKTECGGYIRIEFQDDWEIMEEKSAWSEEDEEIIRSLLDIIYECHSYGKCALKLNEYSKLCDWLKSLRPQNTWKPSDEQMKALEHFVRSVGESGYASPHDNNTKLLYSLLADLKKLREE